MTGLLGHLASQGRHGDTELAHVNPQEKRLLEAMGGAGTINPNTGLREYYFEYEEDPDLERTGGYDPQYEGKGIGGKTGEWLKGEADRWGISTWWRDESYAEEQQRKEYIEKLNSDFNAGIGDFKEHDFANMSEVQRAKALSTLFGFDIKPGDIDKYYDKYDYSAEQELRGEGARDVAAVGEAAQGKVMDLLKSQRQSQARSGFVATGNPMLDRYRQDLFQDIGQETDRTYTSLLHAVRDMESSYNDAIIASAFKHKTAMVDDA